MNKVHTSHNTAVVTWGPSAGPPKYLLQVALAVAASLFTVLTVWQQRLQERQALGEMEQFRLDDMGISREAARREAAKPIWTR